MEDKLNGRWTQLKMSSVEDNLIEDDQNEDELKGRQLQLKTTSIEEDLKWRRP